MEGRRRGWGWIRALTAGVALGLCSVSACGCAWKSHFPDMRERLAALPIPETYEHLYDDQRGVNPPFFADYPQVMAYYRSLFDPERTCDQLASRLEKLTSTFQRMTSGCTLVIEVPSGWRARLWNVWKYGGTVTVATVSPERRTLHRSEPREPYTRVVVALVDRY